MKQNFYGNGIMTWQIKMSTGGLPANTQAGWEAYKKILSDVGFTNSPIKIADGINTFNMTPRIVGWSDDILDGIFNTIITPRIGWQYFYGNAPKNEALKAIQMIKRLKLTNFVIDAEKELKASNSAQKVDIYMDTLMQACPEISYALCSYRFPSLHRELPWEAFLEHMRPDKDVHMPQCYWVGAFDPPFSTNPGEQLKRSVGELKKLKDLEVIPVGSAYGEQYKDQYWVPSIAQLRNFAYTAKELGCPGVSWWELGYMLKPDFVKRGYYTLMPEISSLFGQITPPPVPEPEPTDREKFDEMWKCFIKHKQEGSC